MMPGSREREIEVTRDDNPKDPPPVNYFLPVLKFLESPKIAGDLGFTTWGKPVGETYHFNS
jgi:hypothetical protein